MNYNKQLADTMRIDLTEDVAKPGGPVPGVPVSRLTRMDWQPRRKAPEYVARSRYQELLQSLYDAALVTRLSGEIIDVNARAVEFLRYERADLFVMSIYNIISGADAGLMQTVIDNLDRERFSLIQAYCLRSDGTYFPAEIAISRLRLDEVCLCFFIRDITWRQEAEERLELEHEALQMAGNGIVITDAGRRLVYANPAFAHLVAQENPDALIETDLTEVFVDRPAAEHLFEQVGSDERPWMIETALRRHDGAEAIAQVFARCKHTDEGVPAGYVFSFSDITDLKRSGDQMREEHDALERKVDQQAAEMAELREAAARKR